jgi:hypothetical protein
MVSDRDLTAAVLIAAILILVALYGWPGAFRLRGRDLAGFWASPAGALYRIEGGPGPAFTVRASTHPGRETLGRVTGLRRVVVPGAALGERGALGGAVELGGRRIQWDDGSAWVRQGAGA